MRVRSEFNVLGTIKSQASNGLSVFEKNEKGKKEIGQISGGNIGDIVALDKTNKIIVIIDDKEWQDMPKDEKALSELESMQDENVEALKVEVANLRAEILELKSKLAQANPKENLVLKGDENDK